MLLFIRHVIATTILLLSCTYVFAEGPTTISGKNEIGETISANVDENYIDEPIITPSHPRFGRWAIDVVNEQQTESKEFNRQYCGYSGELYSETWSFSCATEGKSPLAGATYVFDKTIKLPPCGGYPFVCKSGCNTRTPNLMIQAYWECSEDG